MNPRLIKFAVELQNAEKVEKEVENINLKGVSNPRFFNLLKPAKVTVVINNID